MLSLQSKLFLLSACLCCALILSACASKQPEELAPHEPSAPIFDIASLQLDQGDAYIAISSNDASGFNRWVPFYLTYASDANASPQEIKALLNNNISSASLFTEDAQVLFVTDRLVWTSTEPLAGQHKLTLVLLPGLDDFTLDGPVKISKLVLHGQQPEAQLALGSYTLEERETISEDAFYITLSSIESTLSDTLTSRVSVGIFDREKQGISALSLDYPSGFAGIQSYNFLEETQTDDNTTQFEIELQFEKDSPNVVFRPFLKLSYSNTAQIAWLVPAVPTYITKDSSFIVS